MKHPNPNMLLHIAMGDAYAAAVEYVKRDKHSQLYDEALRFQAYLQHPTHLKLKPGMYTDDTQQSIAVAEVLLSSNAPRVPDFLNAFYDVFKRDPRDGYARGFQGLIESVRSPDEFRSKVIPSSNKNGAAMRSVPIGTIKDVNQLVDIAGVQATATHATWGGINSAVAVALMSHFALYDHRNFLYMREWCARYSSAFQFFGSPWSGPVVSDPKNPKDMGVGMNTAWAVCTLLEQETSLMGIMRRVIEWGGDTDSVAAIAWGIAGARYGHEILPSFLEHDLEPGSRYGVQFLKDLGERLMTVEKMSYVKHPLTVVKLLIF